MAAQTAMRPTEQAYIAIGKTMFRSVKVARTILQIGLVCLAAGVTTRVGVEMGGPSAFAQMVSHLRPVTVGAVLAGPSLGFVIGAFVGMRNYERRNGFEVGRWDRAVTSGALDEIPDF